MCVCDCWRPRMSSQILFALPPHRSVDVRSFGSRQKVSARTAAVQCLLLPSQILSPRHVCSSFVLPAHTHGLQCRSDNLVSSFLRPPPTQRRRTPSATVFQRALFVSSAWLSVSVRARKGGVGWMFRPRYTHECSINCSVPRFCASVLPSSNHPSKTNHAHSREHP